MAELDTVLDLGRIGSAELDIIIGKSMAKFMAPADRQTLWRQLGAPVNKRVTMSGTPSAAQAARGTPTAFFSWDIRPQTGRIWMLRKVVIQATGAGPFAGALASVTGALFASPSSAEGMASAALDNPNIDCDQTNFTIPTTQFYSTHQFPIRGGEWLILGVQGAGVTAAVQFWGHARVTEIDDDPALLLAL